MYVEPGSNMSGGLRQYGIHSWRAVAMRTLNLDFPNTFQAPPLYQLTPQHLSPCSHKLSALRYELSSASDASKLTVAALLDRPRCEAASYRHGLETNLHHSYCHASRFVVLSSFSRWCNCLWIAGVLAYGWFWMKFANTNISRA